MLNDAPTGGRISGYALSSLAGASVSFFSGRPSTGARPSEQNDPVWFSAELSLALYFLFAQQDIPRLAKLASLYFVSLLRRF